MTANKKQIGGDHYISLDIQPWEYMEAIFTKDQFEGFLIGNAIKYISRYQEKGGKQDLEKAIHYLEKATDLL